MRAKIPRFQLWHFQNRLHFGVLSELTAGYIHTKSLQRNRRVYVEK